MRILFLCGSFEPGHDGVGDYVRELCAEMCRQGNEAAVIAIKDKYVSEPVDASASIENNAFEVLRIPSSWKDNLRFAKIREWARGFNPDWISLHYVPYSFHKLGTPVRLGSKLKALKLDVNWHVMVHEPYLSFPQKGIKNKLVQALQIRSLQMLRRNLHGAIFHTSVPHYQQMLEQISVKAKTLGLFGNIGVFGQSDKFSQYNLSSDALLAVFFGAVPPAFEHIDFTEPLKKFCQTTRKKLKIILCGRPGPVGEVFAKALEEACSNSMCEIQVAGKLEPEEISHLFSVADFGISRVPARLVGKSGAAISMLEHGLPLWIPLSEGEQDFSYLDFRPDLAFKKLEGLNTQKKAKPSKRLPLIATQLLNDLSSAFGSDSIKGSSKAIIHGCYNTTNFGDLLLLELTAKYLKDRWNIKSETLRLPANIKLEYCKAAPSVLSCLKPKYAIFGGGGYLEDERGSKIGTRRLLRYSLPAKIWKELGIQYAIVAPGGGPTAVGLGAKRIKYICDNASHISLRDTQSEDFVKGIGVTRKDIVVTADFALTIKPADIPASHKFDLAGFVENKANGKKIIGIHLELIYQDTSHFEKFCKLSFLHDKEFLNKFHLIFFYDNRSENTEWVKLQIDNIQGLSYSILHRMNHWSTADFLRQCDAILTTKLHVSIVGAAFGVPVFGFSVHRKTGRFYGQIGREKYQKYCEEGIECINGWMEDLKNDIPAAWHLSESHLTNIKAAAELNFSVLDKYIKSRSK